MQYGNVNKLFRKFYKVIANIFLISAILFVADYSIYKNFCRFFISHFNVILPSYLAYYTSVDSTPNRCSTSDDYKFRPVEKSPNNKKSIILMGCSFTHGHVLNDNQTFSHKLFQQTQGYDVYNFGICASGVQHILYVLKNIKVLDKVENPPDYVIYTYIYDHVERVRAYYFQQGFAITAKIHKGNVELETSTFLPKFFYKTFIMRKLYAIKTSFQKNNIKKYYQDNKEMIYQILLQSKQIVNAKYPNTKFVILAYDNPVKWENCDISTILQKLSNNGFIIIEAKDIVDETVLNRERLSDGFHPNEKAWDILVPKLIEKLNLQKR